MFRLVGDFFPKLLILLEKGKQGLGLIVELWSKEPYSWLRKSCGVFEMFGFLDLEK